MDKYICTNCTLENNLDIVKSPTGINAVWNKDDNTVYYNSNIFKDYPHFEPGYNSLQNLDKKNKVNILFNPQITEEMKDFYRAVRISRTHECGCENQTPNFKKVE